MRHHVFEPEHEAFRQTVAKWVSKAVAPQFLEWEQQGMTPRELFTDAGRLGFSGIAIPEEFGGGGTRDFRFNQIIGEEFAAAGFAGPGLGLTLHNDICTPYFVEYCNEEQSRRWLPGIASGELITAIAMTEPGTGSDLAGIATTAVRDGDDYVLNGSKTFITNGINSDLVIVAARTGPGERSQGLSLLVVERPMDGFERGRKLEKIGLRSQDTAELFFRDVRVPVANRLGDEGAGFRYLSSNLSQERLSIAASSVAAARAAMTWTLDYVREREAFGAPIAGFQNTKFVLAELSTEVEAAQAYVDQCVLALNSERLTAADAARAKLHATELHKRAVDRCVQLFGGYGFMLEFPIARAYTDARVTAIFGGTSEIMKTIIAKSLGL